jgi:hypothetical protein
MTPKPLTYTAFIRSNLCLNSAQAARVFSNTRTLIEVFLPIFFRPMNAYGLLKQFNYGKFVLLNY